jgi:hypothetical protein
VRLRSRERNGFYAEDAWIVWLHTGNVVSTVL